MRVLFIEHHPRFVGGSERMSLALCEHVISRGHRASLVHVERGDMVAAYERTGARCHQLPVLPVAVRHPAAALRSFRILSSVVRSDDIDVLFTSQMAYVPLIAAVGRWTGTTSVAHLGLPLRNSHPVMRAGRYLLNLGVAPSIHTADELKLDGWPSDTLRVIANGVNLSTFCPGNREKARASLQFDASARPLIVYVGRLVPEKGIFTLVRAFARHCAAGGPGFLAFVGAAPGDASADLVAIAGEEHLEDGRWLIRPATSKPEDVYRAADLVVVPSEWDEPFGLVALEAGACGTATVVSDRGVLPDFVTPLSIHGSFVSGNVAELQRRIDYWTEDDERRAIAGARLAEYVRFHYGFERCGDAYLDAFESLIDRAPRRRSASVTRREPVRERP